MQKHLKNTPPTLPIDGYCHPQFEAVRLAFIKNMASESEIGAAVSIVLHGQTVVDLWGGYRDVNYTSPWQQDTLVCVMSVTKAIASLCLLVLADRKQIDLDKPVAEYWPEFAQAGKEHITVRCLLAQLAGIPVVDAAPAGSLYDTELIAQALEQQKPLWKPGTTPCYHSFTHGPLCQKIIEKVTGKSMGQYLREDVLAPFNIEFYIGLSEDEISRCADIILSQAIPSLEKMRQPDTLMHRAWRPMPNAENLFQEAQFRKTQFASGNGHSNARAVAQIYGILAQGGSAEGKSLLSKTTLDDAIIEQWDAVEKITNRHFRYATGFMLNNPYFKVGDNPRSYGHPGLGGSIGFADPDAGIGFGYCCNRIHAIEDTGPFAGALISALYDAI